MYHIWKQRSLFGEFILCVPPSCELLIKKPPPPPECCYFFFLGIMIDHGAISLPPPHHHSARLRKKAAHYWDLEEEEEEEEEGSSTKKWGEEGKEGCAQAWPEKKKNAIIAESLDSGEFFQSARTKFVVGVLNLWEKGREGGSASFDLSFFCAERGGRPFIHSNHLPEFPKHWPSKTGGKFFT